MADGARAVEPSQMISLDPASIPLPKRYGLLTGSIVPRPIAFVSTISSSGITNIAPFSFFNGVASNPPTISISIARKPDGSKKDTLRNIEETGEFVLHGSSPAQLDSIVQSAAGYPEEVSEIDVCGLETIPSQLVRPPRIVGTPYQFECRVYTCVEVGSGEAGSATVVLGEILRFHFRPDILKEYRVRLEAFEPLSRLGGFDYGLTKKLCSREIPEV